MSPEGKYPLALKGFPGHGPIRRDDPVTQSGAALETQGTAMALNHPVEPRPEDRPAGGLHPAISLIVGFATLTVVALVVHALFGLI